jgi:SAM-dependent methyltransferase
MDPIETPYDSSWGGEIHYVCFNDNCGYFTRSWEALVLQGVEGAGYRCRMDARGCCGPIPVSSPDDIKDWIVKGEKVVKGTSDFFGPDDFSRDDETPDDIFYQKPRLVDHLDSRALSTVEDLYARLIPEGSRILDLMAGPDSHLKAELKPVEVTGLGLNKEELDANPALTKRIIHDLNAIPELPFADDQFDAVIITVSVDYVAKPVEVFREVARVSRKEGVFVVVFSNRMFPPKAVKLWKNSTETDRIELVKKYFCSAELFYLDGYFESKGLPRPEDDKYYSFGIPSDPIYAVWGKVVK